MEYISSEKALNKISFKNSNVHICGLRLAVYYAIIVQGLFHITFIYSIC